ncbi:MAG: response regulator transcription factor [Actinobacteria bacterium]|nr:response regulator transcription factor [Actinomycetota bacterium]MCA1719586.1 response regulator transcription factor [Actinomycetota bacterium]
MTIRVLLVDDHALIRQGLRRAFEATDDLQVVDEAGSCAQAMALARQHEPQVCVVDVNLGDGSGIDLCKELRAMLPNVGLVVLTMYDGDEHLFGALEAGASAFVLKSSPADDVASAVRQAAASPTAFTANDLAGAMRRRMTQATVQLTPREHEILQLLGQGMSVAQVSAALFISQSTAKTHMSKLYEKLDASNRTQAVMAAIRLGLLSTEAAR